MISLLLTAALALNATPTQVAAKPAPAAKATARAESIEPVLQSVAVTLECTATAEGRVKDCAVLGETHPGLGFAETAIALMQDAEVAPGPRDVQFARTIQFMP
jgi:hypothetical protein